MHGVRAAIPAPRAGASEADRAWEGARLMSVVMRRIILSGRCTFMQRWREERMAQMVRRVGLFPGARIVDLGGTEYNWSLIDHDYHVTLVNERPIKPLVDTRRHTLVLADACELEDVFDDGAFDFVFSNSTIEHVGDRHHRQRFAEQVRRLAAAYWVQTPSPRFPIECHTGVPFYWQLPRPVKGWLAHHRRQTMPHWDLEIQGITVIDLDELQELFPDSQVYREYRFGFEKSYSMYRPCASTVGALAESPRSR
jgi:hypothetical protein